MFEKIKSGVLYPRKFIEDTDMYKGIQLKYLDTLKFIDDVSFYAPALLMFIMLGGFISRKIEKMEGDAVRTHEIHLMKEKIDELVDVANGLLEIINSRGVQSLTKDEIAQVKKMLEDGAGALPDSEDLK